MVSMKVAIVLALLGLFVSPAVSTGTGGSTGSSATDAIGAAVGTLKKALANLAAVIQAAILQNPGAVKSVTDYL